MNPLARQVQRILSGMEDNTTYASVPGWILTVKPGPSPQDGSVKYHDQGFTHYVSEALQDGGVVVQDRRMYTALVGLGVYNSSQAPSYSYARGVLLDAPLSYWRLDEASGTVALDLEERNNGTYTGTVTLGQPGALSGDFDPAAAFDPGYVALPTITLSSDFSLEAWTFLGLDAVGNNTVFGGTNLQFLVAPNGATFQVPGDGGAGASLSTASNSQVWVHWVYVRQGSTFYVYRNGVQIKTGACTPNSTITVTAIGGSTSQMHGSIDESALYGYALLAQQVVNHFVLAGQGTGLLTLGSASSTSGDSLSVVVGAIPSITVSAGASTSSNSTRITVPALFPAGVVTSSTLLTPFLTGSSSLGVPVSTSSDSISLSIGTGGQGVPLDGSSSTSFSAIALSTSGTAIALAGTSSVSSSSTGFGLSAPFDGGIPSTSSWAQFADGGTPSTTSWSATIDGGTP